MPRKKIELPPRAVIYAKLTATTFNGMPSIEVHGLGGPLTGFVARKNGVEVSLPGATIANVTPGIHYVAWDGDTFVIRPTLESILEYDNLALIGRVEVPQPESPRADRRPPLDPLACEAIDQLLHLVDQRHWPIIAKMRVKKHYPLDSPVPPQAPQQLLGQIRWYATMVFGTEADQYDQFRRDGRYSAWLSGLAERTIKRVLAAVERLDDSDPDALLLHYHGLAKDAIEQHLKTVLSEIGKQYEQGIAPSQRSAPTPSSAPKAPEAETETAHTSAIPQDTLADQLKRFRDEYDLTAEEMAEALGVDVRSIRRHLAGDSLPRRNHISAYENLFSQRSGNAVSLKRPTRPRNVR